MTPDQTSDHLLKAITECVGGMVTGFLVIASYMDDAGEKNVFGEVMQDQRCHETLGLLAFGMAVENKRAAESHNA